METKEIRVAKNVQFDVRPFLMPAGLLLLAVGMRFLPHLFNVTPIIAISLLSGFHFRSKSLAVLVPLLGMFISDLVIGVHPTILFVYAPLVLVVFLGQLMNRRNAEKYWPVKDSLMFSLFGSILFFAISNFGVWALYNFYPKNLLGLTTCFIAGIPFFERSVLGDLMFTCILFSVYALARSKFPARKFASESIYGR